MHVKRLAIRLIGSLFAWLFLLAFAFFAASAHAQEMGGRMAALVEGREILLPLMKTDISADIDGDLATVTVVQTFENPTRTPLNATYLFPLNEDSAVFAMTMEVGDEIVTAQIRRREQARREFERARDEGRAASLLTQHRPNMFTQEVANLMPGMPVKVTLRYAQTVPRVDGAYELVVPMVVGPRYNPREPAPARVARISDGAIPEAQAATPQGVWNIGPPPAYPNVYGLTLPNAIAPERVSVAVDLTAGLSIGDVTSATHALAITGDSRRKRIALTRGRVIDNRDFVLRYSLAGGAVQAGALTHSDARGGFFSLVVEPPRAPQANQIASREIVFVLDTSGSMEGEPIEASKTFMRHALATLRPGDYFRVVQFSYTPREFSAGPVPATPEHVAAAQRFVQGLVATGGTEVAPAMRQAFRVRQQPNTLRLVVFLSDGYIGNEAEVLSEMRAMRGGARVYAFGVGTSVNRYLLSEMARRGRGIARFIDPTETSYQAAAHLAQRLDAPVLTDIAIDWGGLNPADVTPTILPDLFAGDSLRVMGRFTGSREAIVTISGKVDGRPARLPVRIRLSDASASNSAIPLVWARSQIADLMRDYASQAELRTSGLNERQLEERVTRLGLDYALVTDWTSFVAVSNKIVNANPAAARDASVPLPMPEGVGPGAYGEMAISPATFGGASAPEPGVLALLALLLALTLAGAMWRGRAERRTT